MAFTIQLMYNNEPMNKITKSPVSVGDPISGTLRDESSIVDPVILLETANPKAANYAYIEEFSRYYYIRNWEAVRNGLWRCTMHCDVLKTFSEGILGSPCVVAKSSNRFNLYLNDTRYKVKQNDLISVEKFSNGFNIGNSEYVITMFGDRTQTP